MIYPEVSTAFEEKLTTLSPQVKKQMAVYGSYLLLTEVESRLALAKDKLAFFQKKYGVLLDDLNKQGLPDDAGWEMHEDYVEWTGWQASFDEATETLNALKNIVDAADVISFAR